MTFRPNHRFEYLLSGFVQDEIGLVANRLSVTLGTKLLNTNFTHGIDLQPSVRLLWTPSDKQSYWAAFTHALRTPSDGEANFDLSGYIGNSGGVPFFARFSTNKNFAPEQPNGHEAGYRRLVSKNLFVDVTGFYNHYHNLFSEDLTGPAFLESDPNAPSPHAVLLDLNLPKIDGLEILRTIRASPGLKDIPVLVVTSSDSPQDRAEVSKLGASYFQKPVT